MFFPDRIISIKENDRVLEIGPGASPYFRSDIFLELNYKSDEERIAQSGHVGILESDKPISYYDGLKFPFKDKEFDYVICSHVLEHVDNADIFLKEIQRVGKKGYLEFPTIYYDYLYNFPEHKLFLFHKDDVIYWMTKMESGLLKYKNIQKLFYKTAELGIYSLTNELKNYFFQGFEWSDEITSKNVNDLDDIIFDQNVIDAMGNYLKRDANLNKINFNEISLKKFLYYRLRKVFK